MKPSFRLRAGTAADSGNAELLPVRCAIQRPGTMEEPKSATFTPTHLLLFGDRNQDFDSFCERLRQAGGDKLKLDCVHSQEEVRSRLAKGSYDALLSDSYFDINAIGQGLPKGNNLPVVLVSDLDESKLQHEISSAFCARQCGSWKTGSCVGLPVYGAIARQRKERQWQDSEEMLRKLQATVEQSPEVVMITDYSGVLEYVNPAFEMLTGYSREEVIGQTLGVLKSEQQSGESYEEMWDTLLSGRAFHGMVVNRKKNGETFTLEKTITPLHNSAGRITHFISTGRDITEQRRLESELKQAQKMDVVGRLAGGVAHDFNNLLMIIGAYAELTLDALAPEHPLRQNVSEIMGASRRAADLTRQLLAFGRKQVQALQLLDLNEVIQEISRMLPRLMGEDIQLVLVPGPRLGKVEADPVQIEQVVMNLAANARDAMPRGGRLTIETSNLRLDEFPSQEHATVPPGEYVLTTFTDMGQGIAPEHLPHIFEPFYTTKDEGKGTGLGLATVYGIVKQSGGCIRVFSEVGAGTSFRVYLPRCRADARRALPSLVAPRAPRGCETVLLVEDEAALRHSTRQFLVKNGYTVLEAANGEDALRVSREYRGAIHMMISDVVMPDMSGPILGRQLSAARPEMKILFISGYAENTVLRHGEIDLSTCFLQKPFTLGTLAQKTRKILDSNAPCAFAAASSD